MRRAVARTRIAAPAAAVWALYADTERTPEWVPFVEEVVSVSGPLAEGMTYRERTRLGPAAMVNEWRVSQIAEPSLRTEESTSMGLRSTLIIRFENWGDTTLLSQQSIIRSRLPGPLAALHERIVVAVAEPAMQAAVDAAKRRLEGRQSGDVGAGVGQAVRGSAGPAS
ncbi:MAG: SRPBCC family protein [Chloroflexota bacterium]